MKKTKNLIALIGDFLIAENTVVVESINNEKSGVTILKDEIIFELPTMHIAYESCHNIAPKKELDFLYNILNLHTISLAALQKENNCLSSVSNHELKNILSSAKLSLEMLSTYDFDKEDRSKLLSQAFNAVTQSVSLFDEMLMIEKLQHQQKNNTIDIKMIQIRPLIESILQTLHSEITSKSIQTEIIDESNNISIHASMFWIERALFNLISNAVKYNKEGGMITIHLKAEKKLLQVVVTDSGIGIKESEQYKVLQKFETSSDTQNQGTGVGLALVKAIADAHKGTLKFQSSYGEGTTFTLTLPRKNSANKIQHPIAVMNAAAVLLLVGVSYLFPVIPSFSTIEHASNFDIIKLDHGSTIKIDKGAQYSFWDFHNLNGQKFYRHLQLDKGKAEADLHDVHVAFATPTSSFTNLGTELSFEQKPQKGVVSVYEGELDADGEHVYKGEGFVSTPAGIKVVELLEPPYGLSGESEHEGELHIHFNAVADAKKYRLILAKDAQFSQIIARKENVGTSFKILIKKDGYYHVKVAALDKNGILGLPNTAVISNTYHLQQGITARENQAYAKAEKFLKQSINEFDKHNAEPYSELAWTYYLQQSYPQAVRYFKQALSIHKTEKDAMRLARTFFHLKEYAKADEIYKQTLKENPNNIDALWGKAELQIINHKYLEAKKTLQKLLQLDSTYPLANYDMARVMFLMKDKQKGLYYLKKEMQAHPENRELTETMRREVLAEK